MNRIIVDITDDIIGQIRDLDETIEEFNSCDNPLQSAKNWFVNNREDKYMQLIQHEKYQNLIVNKEKG